MRYFFYPILLLLAVGCARFPDTGAAARSKRFVFRMQMDGAIRTGLEGGGAGLPYVYIVALNLSNDLTPTTSGPLPVVIPGGNGFVAGTCTHYILWNPLSSPAYTIWQFRDAALNESFQIGSPIAVRNVNVGDKIIEFEIDLTQLVTAAQADLVQSVQMNFLTMNNTRNSGGGRLWDALGDGRFATGINRPFTFQTRFATTYTNANQGEVEPVTAADVVDPDLDIRDWSIEVKLP